MKRIFSLCALLACFSVAAFADVRMPDTPKPTPAPPEKRTIETDFRISLRKDAKEARLLIPKDQIRQLRAQLDELDGGPPAPAAFFSFSRAQTIIGGLFLSLAFVFGGIRLTRARKGGFKPNRAVAGGAVLFVGGAAAVMTFANAGPPSAARSITGKMFSPAVHVYKFGWGKVKLETTDDDQIELIVPDVPDDKKDE